MAGFKMDDDACVIARRLTRIVSLSVMLVFIAVVLASIISVHTGAFDIEEEEPFTLRVDGTHIYADAKIVVRSGLFFNLTDVDIRADIVDGTNSQVRLCSMEGIRIEAMSQTHVALNADVFAPSLYLILSDLIEKPSSAIPVRISLLGDYFCGVARFDASLMLSVALADEGEVVEVECSSTESEVSVSIANLKDQLLPGPMHYTISCYTCTVEFVSDVADGTVNSVVRAYDADGEVNLEKALDSILASYAAGGPSVTNIITGESMQISENAMNSIVFAVFFFWDGGSS